MGEGRGIYSVAMFQTRQIRTLRQLATGSDLLFLLIDLLLKKWYRKILYHFLFLGRYKRLLHLLADISHKGMTISSSVNVSSVL